jgi:hypothetical protein
MAQGVRECDTLIWHSRVGHTGREFSLKDQSRFQPRQEPQADSGYSGK